MNRTRLTLSLAFLAGLGGTALAEDNGWVTIKRLFHEPVSKIIQEFERPGGKAPAAKPAVQAESAAKADTAKVAPAEEKAKATDSAAVPIPRPRPEIAGLSVERDVTTSETPPAAGSANDAQAMAAAPETAVKPAEETVAADDPGKADDVEVPIPPVRPNIITAYAPNENAVHKGSAVIGALTPPDERLIKPPPAANSTCGAGLARLGVEAAALAPINEGRCGVEAPVALASLGGGATELTAKAITECALAEAFANWIRDAVQPRAREILGGEVTGLRVAASYHCRNRNGLKDTKLSEHGKGNAIDISAFDVEGHGWITVGGSHKGKAARFLKEVRASACGPFTTVLGPGSDAYHSDHFHLDLAQRNKRGKSRGLYCH